MTSLFGSTAPPPSSVIVSNYNSSDTSNNYSINTLKEDLISKIDSIQPRIQSISSTFPQAIESRSKKYISTTEFATKKINDIQSLFDPIHSSSITLSKRCQNLTLSVQSISSLAAPQKLRLIQTNFSNFQSEFDGSLNSIAILAKNLTTTISRHKSLLEPMNQMSQNVQKSFSEIHSLSSKTSQNSKFLEDLQAELTKKSEASFSSTSKNLEKQIKESELLITQMTEQTTQGFSEAKTKSEKLQSQKFDIKTSFLSLTDEIQAELSKRIELLQTNIKKSQETTMISIEKLQQLISSELDQIADETAAARHYSLLDEVEQEKETAEIEELIEKLSSLEKEIQEFPNQPIKGEPERFKVVMDDHEMTICCYQDGTFTID